MKKIILTADDYGVNEYIDSGIDEGIKQGRISSVAVMVTHPSRIETSMERLLHLKQTYTFGVGLHLSTSSGYSLLPHHTTLVDFEENGMWRFRGPQNYPFKSIALNDLREEFKAQLRFLDDLLGDIKIDSVSNHQGFAYIDLVFFKVYIDTIVEYCADSPKYTKPIPIRSPISWLKTGLPFLDYDRKLSVPFVREGLSLGLAKKYFEVTKGKLLDRVNYAKAKNVVCPSCTADTIYGQPFAANIEFLIRQYERFNFSSEFMLHLGKGSTITHAHGINTDYMPSRNKELEALGLCPVEQLLNHYKVELITFKEL